MKKLILAVIFSLLGISSAFADNCGAYPYTLTNGTTADANQVMQNFNNVLSCGNNLLLGKNNNLSDVQSPSTSRSNLGLGGASVKGAQGSDTNVPTTTSVFIPGHFAFYTSSGGISDSNTGPSSFLQAPNNLSDVANAASSRSNLGLGTIATANITASTSGPSGTANTGDLWFQYAP